MRGLGKSVAGAVAALSIALASPAMAQDDTAAASQWITLGTKGGPLSDANRSQPANVLIAQDGTWLVDIGDGTAQQLAKAGVPLGAIDAVFISHLHFDHTAGLVGLLGLRWQTDVSSDLTIYGPPGTRAMVDGLLAAMLPTTQSGYGVPGAPVRPPETGIKVVELRDNAALSIGDARVTARKNSHYSFAPGSADDANYESLSFRFDLPDRDIVYSGDTGPSAAVTDLARGADLLVVEMIDVDRTIADIRRLSPNVPAQAFANLETHLREHHLTPGDVGELASDAEVGAVVVTHLSGPDADGANLLGYVGAIAQHYTGPVVIADDLERF
ncbi:MBL fold metallo-hydrolase [Aurantiacibacter rhizosphaerae]|uniref:MBL fold metallo-hydrolase n=1 Tax=Aurantiacibacter rhizosphaerae TaxID=2691582 RepID=A0A844XGC8_9SPHN|nr:MBL fold metallo-hydrolase [Aurantiacibacter rhizosphaerae]MWV28644.1 MBL fold metallo-hydrolase [Aurantiacibacter rhizosphaerae]